MSFFLPSPLAGEGPGMGGQASLDAEKITLTRACYAINVHWQQHTSLTACRRAFTATRAISPLRKGGQGGSRAMRYGALNTLPPAQWHLPY